MENIDRFMLSVQITFDRLHKNRLHGSGFWANKELIFD